MPGAGFIAADWRFNRSKTGEDRVAWEEKVRNGEGVIRQHARRGGTLTLLQAVFVELDQIEIGLDVLAAFTAGFF